MGLTIPQYSHKGVTVENAYGKILRVFGGKMEGWGSVFHVYASKEAADSGIEPLNDFNVNAPYNPDNMNSYELIYNQAKLDKRLPGSFDNQ